MEKFIEALKVKLRPYYLEVILLLTAFCIVLFSIIVLIFNLQNPPASQPEMAAPENSSIDTQIFVDIEGGVNKPDLYTISAHSRLGDLIKKAGGLSSDADREYFAKEFNLSQRLSDEQKIYIPLSADSSATPENQPDQAASSPDTGKLNINTATTDQLESLPGIGSKLADKIVGSRPYKKIDDLLSTKILTQSVFDKVKTLIDAP